MASFSGLGCFTFHYTIYLREEKWQMCVALTLQIICFICHHSGVWRLFMCCLPRRLWWRRRRKYWYSWYWYSWRRRGSRSRHIWSNWTSDCLCVRLWKEYTSFVAILELILKMSFLYRVIVAVAAYFIIGAIIMRTKYQATGTDMIPNKDFWFNIPFLIKVKLLLPLMAVFFIVIWLTKQQSHPKAEN